MTFRTIVGPKMKHAWGIPSKSTNTSRREAFCLIQRLRRESTTISIPPPSHPSSPPPSSPPLHACLPSTHPILLSICSTLARHPLTISRMRPIFSNSFSNSSICAKIARKRAISASACCTACPARSCCACVASSVARLSCPHVSTILAKVCVGGDLPDPAAARSLA